MSSAPIVVDLVDSDDDEDDVTAVEHNQPPRRDQPRDCPPHAFTRPTPPPPQTPSCRPRSSFDNFVFCLVSQTEVEGRKLTSLINSLGGRCLAHQRGYSKK